MAPSLLTGRHPQAKHLPWKYLPKILHFCLKGPENPNEITQGLIPRVMKNMFNIIDEAEDEYLYVIKVSFLEIYNEKIHDLLDSKLFFLIVRSKNQSPNKRRSPKRHFCVRTY